MMKSFGMCFVLLGRDEGSCGCDDNNHVKYPEGKTGCFFVTTNKKCREYEWREKFEVFFPLKPLVTPLVECVVFYKSSQYDISSSFFLTDF